MAKVEESGRSNSEYSRFDKYDTAVLEAILQADFDAPEAEQMEMEQALYISNLIAERKGTKPKDVATAKAEFFEHYYPLVGEEDTLYEFDDDVLRNNAVKNSEANVSVWLKNWRRFASAAAVFVLLMFSGTVTAYALGFNPIAAIGRWNEEHFWFDDTSVTSELSDKLAEYGYPENNVPKCLPAGYILKSLDEGKNGDSFKSVIATFVKQTDDGIDTLIISYTINLGNDNKPLYEKDTENVVQYVLNDKVYYIMTNLDNRVIAWKNGNFEGTIIGNFTIEEAEKIIKSIDGE